MERVGIVAAGDRQRVLVVGPDRTYAAVVAHRLVELGYRVATAEGAQAGLAEFYRVPPDVVVCDSNLPGTSGVDFVRMIRDGTFCQDVPVLLVVGRSDTGGAVRAFRAGADGVVRKPFHFEVLAACIARQIERAEALKRLVDDNAALDARVISRSIELREMREQLSAAESERRRLATIIETQSA